MFASVLQLAGLALVIGGACVLAGVAGFLIGGGLACVYVGLAVEAR